MNTGDLIGQLLQSGMARGAGSRMQAASQTQPGLGGLLGSLLGGGGGAGGSGGGLGSLLGGAGGAGGLGSLLGGGSGGGGGLGGLLGGGRGASSGGGGLGGLAEMAGGFLNQGRTMAAQNPKVAAGGIGGLVGSMLGGGRMSGAMGGAAMGVIGMIAMNALRSMGQTGQAATSTQAATAPAPVPAQPVSVEDVPVPSEETQKLILMAMISAAKADGHVDDAEMNLIVGKLKETGADSEERDWVLRELGKPLDVDTLVAAVPGLEVAAQVYAASILAITADTLQEVAYLDQLSTKLGLQPAVRSYIHQSLGLPLQAA